MQTEQNNWKILETKNTEVKGMDSLIIDTQALPAVVGFTRNCCPTCNEVFAAFEVFKKKVTEAHDADVAKTEGVS
jgi:hypothetical protein